MTDHRHRPELDDPAYLRAARLIAYFVEDNPILVGLAMFLCLAAVIVGIIVARAIRGF